MAPRHGHRRGSAALSVAYGAGLRASEVAGLKVGAIDSQRMALRIEHELRDKNQIRRSSTA